MGKGIDDLGMSLDELEAAASPYLGPRGDREWDEPIPLVNAPDLPPFPLKALPPWLRDFAEAVSVSTGTPPDLAAMVGLGVVSSSLAGVLKVEIKSDWVLPVNLYIVVACPPSTGKSPVFNAFAAPIWEYEKELERKWAPKVAERAELRRCLEAEQEKARKAKGGAGKEQAIDIAKQLLDFPPLSSPRLLADAATPEALVSVMAANGGRLAVMSDEGGTFQDMAGRYSEKPNMDVYLKSWEGSRLQVDRVSRATETLVAPILTFVLTVQPSVLTDLAKSPALEQRGLVQRFLFSVPRGLGPRTFDAPAVPDDVKQAFDRSLRSLLESHPCEPGPRGPVPRKVPLSAGARDLFAPFYKEIENRRLTDLDTVAQWAGKRAGDTAKIACLIDACERPGVLPQEVTEGSMARAIEIMRYLIPHGQHAFALLGLDPSKERAEYVRDRIVARHRGVGPFSERDVLSWCSGPYRRADVVSQALATLEEHGFVKRDRSARGEVARPGRPRSPSWLVNPSAQNSQNSQKS